MSPEGETISIFGNIDPEKLNNSKSCFPYKDKFFISDSGNHCIKAFDKSGTFLHRFGKRGNQDGQFDSPYGLLINRSHCLLVCDQLNHRVQQFSLDGRFTGKSITHLPSPRGIAATSDGRILVTTPKKIFILKQLFQQTLINVPVSILLLMVRTVSFLKRNNRRLKFVSLFFSSRKLYRIQLN